MIVACARKLTNDQFDKKKIGTVLGFSLKIIQDITRCPGSEDQLGRKFSTPYFACPWPTHRCLYVYRPVAVIQEEICYLGKLGDRESHNGKLGTKVVT